MTTTDTASPHAGRAQPTQQHRYDQYVLEALQSTTRHPTAIELYDMVHQKYPRMGRATVYRALQRLEDAGLALAVGRDTRGRHYDAHVARHDHAVCSVCGQIFDLPSPGASLPPDALAPFYQAARAVGVEPESWEMRIHGRCANCRKAQPPAE